MKGLENPTYLIAYIISNLVGVIFLISAVKKPNLARLMFFLLFGWASVMNYMTAQNNPEDYLSYSLMALKWYSDFINGWFKDNIRILVTMISIGQALISLGMLLKGWWVKMACAGVIIFLMSIAPLGVGSAFPFSITVSLAAFFILRNDKMNYLWKQK
jgi:hypothetical protein